MPVGPALDLRAAIARLPSSKIREIAHAGMGRADLIPLWFGEPDTPTPKFICDAAAHALAAGDTFYQPNAGIDELRATLAEYMNGLYGARLTPENVIVSASAMNALMLDPCDDYLRLCFAATLPTLEQAFERLECFMASV